MGYRKRETSFCSVVRIVRRGAGFRPDGVRGRKGGLAERMGELISSRWFLSVPGVPHRLAENVRSVCSVLTAGNVLFSWLFSSVPGVPRRMVGNARNVSSVFCPRGSVSSSRWFPTVPGVPHRLAENVRSVCSVFCPRGSVSSSRWFPTVPGAPRRLAGNARGVCLFLPVGDGRRGGRGKTALPLWGNAVQCGSERIMESPGTGGFARPFGPRPAERLSDGTGGSS